MLNALHQINFTQARYKIGDRTFFITSDPASSPDSMNIIGHMQWKIKIHYVSSLLEKFNYKINAFNKLTIFHVYPCCVQSSASNIRRGQHTNGTRLKFVKFSDSYRRLHVSVQIDTLHIVLVQKH